MEMYQCTLIDSGIVIENFYREGDSAEDVREGLEMFQWPSGEWEIEII